VPKDTTAGDVERAAALAELARVGEEVHALRDRWMEDGRAIDERQFRAIESARSIDIPWNEIAEALGVTEDGEIGPHAAPTLGHRTVRQDEYVRTPDGQYVLTATEEMFDTGEGIERPLVATIEHPVGPHMVTEYVVGRHADQIEDYATLSVFSVTFWGTTPEGILYPSMEWARAQAMFAQPDIENSSEDEG